MESSFLSYLLEDEIEKGVATEKASWEAKLAQATQEKAVLEKELIQEQQKLQQMLYRILTKRFPQAPVIVTADIQRITQTDLLQELIVELGATDDFASWEQLLKETVAKNLAPRHLAPNT